MKVIVATSTSAKIADYASLTVPHTAAYCLRHGYSHMVINESYEEAAGRTDRLADLFGMGFDLVWSIDADCVITDMAKKIHTLDCLGPHITVCEEGIVEWNRINCGSVVWRKTSCTEKVLRDIASEQRLWRHLPCGWQTLIQMDHGPEWESNRVVTVAPLRSFNSCAWNQPGGAVGPAGSHWQPGDFVFHPCGVFPQSERTRMIAEKVAANGN